MEGSEGRRRGGGWTAAAPTHTHTHAPGTRMEGSERETKEQGRHIKLRQDKISPGYKSQKLSLPRYSMPERVIECLVFVFYSRL